MAFWPALAGGFIWDDDDYVTQNMALRTVGGLRDIWTRPGTTTQYYPVTYTSFWVERHLWGDHPRAFHTANVALHIASAILLWRLLLWLGFPGAWWAGLLWAIHPVQVESVAWVTERKNCLSGTFYFLSALLYLRSQTKLPGTRSRTERIEYALSLAAFGAALLSKTAACSLPAALLLVGWWKSGTIRRRNIWDLTPHFALGFALAAMTVYMEHRHVGAAGAEFQLTIGQRIIIAGRAVVFYLESLVWPARLAFVYPRWGLDTGDIRAWLYPACVATGLVGLWLARVRVGRGPITTGLYFVGTLLPTLGLIDLYYMRFSFVADHFQYLACAGPIVLVVAAVARIRAIPLPVLGLFGATTAVGLAILTMSRSRVFHDSEALWRNTLARNPNAWLAMSGLGYCADLNGKPEEAARWYGDALKLAPGDVRTRRNLAGVRVRLGDVDGATTLMREGVERSPRDKLVHFAMGDHLASTGRVDEAELAYREALKIDPAFAEGHNNLGSLLLRRGDAAAAVTELAQAARLNPYMPEAEYQLGEALSATDKPWMGENPYRAAIELRPDWIDPKLGLAKLLRRLGYESQAIASYRECLLIDPRSNEALTHLAWMMATSGNSAIRDGREAVALAERLLQTSPPDSVMPLIVLSAAFAEIGDFDRATTTAQSAVNKAAAIDDPTSAALAKQLLSEAESRHPHRTPAANDQSRNGRSGLVR